MDLDDAEAVTAFDVATIIAAIRSGLSPVRRRGLWSTVAQYALTGIAAARPVPSAESRLAALSDAELYMWSDQPLPQARWDRPAFRVRRSLVQAVTRRENAPDLLSAALDQAAELPEESGPLGHDAAVLVISSATLGLDKALRDSRPLQRQALARKLRGEAEQSDDPEVAELGDFVAGRLRATVPRIEVAADLPWLMRTEGVQPARWRSRAARGDTQPVEAAAGQYGLRPVLPS